MRLLLYTGKGGVGKTTTAAATAVVAARRGVRTLVLSADAAHSLGDVLGRPLDGTGPGGPVERGDPIAIAPGLDALEIDSRKVIERHWGRIRAYIVDLLRHQGIDEMVAEELALLPGAEELSTLVTVDAWAESGRYDLIVVDCAPTGSTLRLVSLPEVAHGGLRWLLKLQRAAAWLVEPVARGWLDAPMPKSEVFAEAERLLYRTLMRLRDRLMHAETHVRLVVTPETMVIGEALRSLTDLALYGLRADAVVMNRIWPEAALSEAFFRDQARAQAQQRGRVERLFEPMAILEAPLRPDEILGYEALLSHGEALFAGRDPRDVFGERPGLRFAREGDRGSLRLPMPGRDPSGVEVARIDDELVISVDGRRRQLPLPAGLHRMEVERVAVEGEELRVTFVTRPSETDPGRTAEAQTPSGVGGPA